MHVIPDKALNRRPALPARQQGAVAVIVALSLMGLIGIVGLALDLGKLFVAKSELQNSADACALAAARELTGANTNQLKLARAAGFATGERHQVLFQGEAITRDFHGLKVEFSKELHEQPHDGESEPLAMRFAHCEVKRPEIANWFIQVLNLLPGVDIGDQTVGARAVASLVPGQTTCALPMAVCEDSLTDKSKGDWLEALLDSSSGLTGDFLWVRYPPNPSGVNELKRILEGPGQCNVQVTGNIDSEPGRNQGAFDAWNTRFGIYKGQEIAQPDYSGYAYTAQNWAVHGCRDAASDFFQNRRKNYEPYQGNDETGLSVAPPGRISTQHRNKGGDRRVVAVPVVDCASFAASGSHSAPFKSWACVLMLHPLVSSAKSTDPAFQGCPGASGNSDMFLEYLGLADDPDSPCASAGVVGGPGSSGPLVPALVR